MGAILKKIAVFLKENALCPVELLCPPSLISKSTIFDFERRDGGYDFIPLHLLFQNRHLYIMLAAAVRIKHLEKTLAAAVRIKHLATSCLQLSGLSIWNNAVCSGPD